MRATHSQVAIRRVVRLAGEEAFGLVEFLVAAVLVVVGTLSAFTAFEASQRASGRGERTAVVAHRAQSEMEHIVALPYASVGMETTPTNSGSGNSKDPLNYVVNALPGYEYDWAQPAKQETFAKGGTLAPSSSWTDGNLSGTLYRFVTWVADACPSCANSQDYKRVTIVVTTSGTAAPLVTATLVSK